MAAPVAPVSLSPALTTAVAAGAATSLSGGTSPRENRPRSRSKGPAGPPPPPTNEEELKFYTIINAFNSKDADREHKFPATLTPKERAIVHSWAEQFGLVHTSEGTGEARVIVIRKNTPIPITDSMAPDAAIKALAWNQSLQQGQIDKLLNLVSRGATGGSGGGGGRPVAPGDASAVHMALSLAATECGTTEITAKVEPTPTGSPAPSGGEHAPPSPWVGGGKTKWVPKKHEGELAAVKVGPKPFRQTSPPAAGTFRFAGWNIEWMDHLFTGSETDPKIAAQSAEDGIHDVPALARQIASVITKLDPDVIAIEEGPASLERMNLFIATFLEGKYTTFGGIDGAQQRVYILVKKNSVIKNAALHAPSMDFLRKDWYFDVAGDFNLAPYKFTRTPIVVKGEVQDGDKTQYVYFMGLHTKSKYIAKGKELWTSKNPSIQMEFIKSSVKNRRRIAGECTRTRKCIDTIIFAEHADAWVIVSGDFNDGPGTDFFEEYYLLSDCISSLMGSPFFAKKLLHAALLEHSTLEEDDHLFTVVFNDFVDKVKEKRVLLDHILISTPLNNHVTNVGIAHDLYRASSADASSPKRADRVSDHIPVFSDFSVRPSRGPVVGKPAVAATPTIAVVSK